MGRGRARGRSLAVHGWREIERERSGERDSKRGGLISPFPSAPASLPPPASRAPGPRARVFSSSPQKWPPSSKPTPPSPRAGAASSTLIRVCATTGTKAQTRRRTSAPAAAAGRCVFFWRSGPPRRVAKGLHESPSAWEEGLVAGGRRAARAGNGKRRAAALLVPVPLPSATAADRSIQATPLPSHHTWRTSVCRPL